MENTAQLKDKANLTHVFDLKGSLVNREVEQVKPSTTLKDQNFVGLQMQVDFGSHKDSLMYAIRNDVELLKSLNIMDYSLLLFIETKGDQKHECSQHTYIGKDIYHIAIIDYLQVWNINKKSERFYKCKI